MCNTRKIKTHLNSKTVEKENSCEKEHKMAKIGNATSFSGSQPMIM